jgi:hypothetical protein
MPITEAGDGERQRKEIDLTLGHGEREREHFSPSLGNWQELQA